MPRKLRMRNILRRMITPHLVFSAAIGRAQIKTLELVGIGCDAKSEADKTSCAGGRVGLQIPSEFKGNFAILKVRLRQNQHAIIKIALPRSSPRYAQRRLALISNFFSFDVVL